MLVLQDSVGIDRECVGNLLYAERFRHWTGKSVIEILGPRHLILDHEFPPFLFIAIDADA